VKVKQELRIVVYEMEDGKVWYTLRDPKQKRGSKIRASSNDRRLFFKYLSSFAESELSYIEKRYGT